MRIFQSLSLIVALAICYLLFFRSQSALPPAAKDTGADGALSPEVQSASVLPAAKPRTQYKADIDRARSVASQLKAARQEPDTF